MKKYFLLALAFLSFTSFGFAQEGIKNVSLGFCNEGTGNLSNKYTIMVEPGQQKDLCVYVQNKSSTAVVVNYSFPKASFSKGGNQMCDTSNDFAKFFVENPNRSVILSGGSSVTIKETVIAPAGVIGMYYGCLAYQLSKPESEKMGGVFDLVVRKTAFVNLFVGSEDSIANSIQLIPVTGDVFSTNKNVGASYNEDGDFVLKFLAKNNGNLTQNVSLEGKLYNFLGFEKAFTIPVKKLLPGEVYEASANVGIVPFYKGLFSVRTSLKGEPVFEFDASNIKEEFKQTTIIKETSSLFVFSWVYVIVAVLLLGLVIKIIFPKKKKPLTVVEV